MLEKSFKTFALVLLVFACSSITLGQERSGSGVSAVTLKLGQPVRILFKPDPEFPREISTDSEITIVLRAELSADKKVRNVRFIKATPNDAPKQTVKIFKQRAIDSAKRIKFIPAERNSRPVSMLVEIEYSFAPPTQDQPSAAPAATDSPQPEDRKPKV